ncbi:hypothetical protein GW17_00056017 [Ensete ventricosum]|nr:hypothetical protein GW17_00056017 [Ensete ventricosum]
MKSQQGGSPDHKENPLEKEEHVTDPTSTRMRVDFPQWEDGDPTGLLSRAERYFRYQWTLKAFMGQEITADFFLLPLENNEAVLGIEWLSSLGDVF